LIKTTAVTILDNSPGTYDSKYKEVCDLLKKLFARHLKQYGHIRHTQVDKVKHTIPKLKWKTKENFHDCGIFTMLHMETFDGGPTSNLDCGLPVESRLQRDMLRRLRFKFATKILLHAINVRAEKMLELAKEFDKTDPDEKMAIIVDAFKKRKHSEHFYVIVFSLIKTTAVTILDNSPGTYDSKYKEVCDLLKKLFARHLKQYGHIRHTQVDKVKHTIPKLKWKTKENFHDCGIFTMLHMETFDGGPTSNLDCGLPVESRLQRDMLRRLRFKFATKILLHAINVRAEKMLELAKEFDKTDPDEKMAIIVDAFKKRVEKDMVFLFIYTITL
nr:hypothetical protein [Tanacetum cinerariifolium]